jgi:hypothetical protein
MKRADNPEHTRRINKAIKMLGLSKSTSEIIQSLVQQYCISQSQAYRYVQTAQRSKTLLSIPQKKTTFTAKLPVLLVEKIRTYAEKTKKSLSEVVVQALEQFFMKG